MANSATAYQSSTGLSTRSIAIVICAAVGLILFALISGNNNKNSYSDESDHGDISSGSSSSSSSSSKIDAAILNDIYGKLNSIHNKVHGIENNAAEEQERTRRYEKMLKDEKDERAAAVALPPVASSNGGGGICPQVKQYEPSKFPWKRGQPFPAGKTPLTMLKNGEVPPRKLPSDWDGGYGWVFVKYLPSPFELKWAERAKTVEKRMHGYPLCDLFKKEFSSELAKYESQMTRMPPDSGGTEQCNWNNFPPHDPMQFDPEVFSRFEYEWKCTQPPCRTPNAKDAPRIGEKKHTYIEPLVGLLRHPQACWKGERIYSWLVSKNYMVVDTWSLMNPSRSTISPEPKVFYLDGGASTWGQGVGGASQSWFHRVYEARCINFTDWFMFEAHKHDPAAVFKHLPGHVKPGYRWYNIYLKTDPADWDNPINHFLVEAKKEDIVVFKIDFDSATVELALLQMILDFPEVAELIDELYFEHHVNLEILRNHWGTGGSKEYHTDSIKLFTALRERGVRAHSWV